jgi:8-oxo-dGTP diphosphatase
MEPQRYRSLVAVYAVVMNVQNKILLLRRANTGYRDGYYDMPAGHLEEGETLRHATLRELKEETGLQANEEDVEFIELLHRFSHDRVYVDVFFRINKWTGEAMIKETEKCDHMDWFSLDDLPEMIVPHQGRVIKDHAVGITYREIVER